MTAPKDKALIDYQADEFAKAFQMRGADDDLAALTADVQRIDGDVQKLDGIVSADDIGNEVLDRRVTDLDRRVGRLEVIVVLIIFWIFHQEALSKAGITSAQDFKRAAEAKASERKKQYEAMGGASGAGFSLEELEEAFRVAREVL